MHKIKLELSNKGNKYRSLSLLLIRFSRKWLWNDIWWGGGLLVNDLEINIYGRGGFYREREWCTCVLHTQVNWWGALELNILPQLSCIGLQCPGLRMPASNSHWVWAVQERHDLGWSGFEVEDIPEGFDSQRMPTGITPSIWATSFSLKEDWMVHLHSYHSPPLWFSNPLIYILWRSSSYKTQVGFPFQGNGSRWKTFPLLQLILAVQQMLTIPFLHYLT